MAARVGLYYPFIHFRDEGWLKTAALYWAELQRIVPAGYPKRDSSTVEALADAGCISDWDPEGHADGIADAFMTLISEHRDALRSRFGIDQTDVWAGPAPWGHWHGAAKTE